MTGFEIIKKRFYNLLSSSIFQFYPLTEEQIEAFKPLIHWHFLSQNESVEWTKKLIKAYKNDWIWSQLAQNKGVCWDEDLVKTYKTKVDSGHLFRNPNFVITETMLKEGKTFFIPTNNHLSDELKEKYKEKQLRVGMPSSRFSNPIIIDESFEYIQHSFNVRDKGQRELTYQKYIKPNINNGNIEDLLIPKIKDETLFYLESKKKHFSFINTDYRLNANKFDNVQGKFEKPITLRIDDNINKNHTAFAMLKLGSGIPGKHLVVSESFKHILDQFELPITDIQKVEVTHPKVLIKEPYYFITLEWGSGYKYLDYERVEWTLTHSNYHKIRELIEPIKAFEKRCNEEIKSYEDLIKMRRETLNGLLRDIKIIPKKFHFVEPVFDLYIIDNFFFVNKYLKEVIDWTFPNQLHFSSNMAKSFELNQSFKDSREMLVNNLKKTTQITPIIHPTPSKEDLFFEEKINRIIENDQPHNVNSGDEFEEVEKRLNVVFNNYFKDFYRRNKNEEDVGSGHRFLDINRFYICNDYAKFHPSSYKSVVVALNGIGDTLHCFLERNSDYLLEEGMISIFHETGELDVW